MQVLHQKLIKMVKSLIRLDNTISEPFYEIMGIRVACLELQATRSFNLEHETYQYLKSHSAKFGWKLIRVDTVAQQGFPDCLLLNHDKYWLIEVKMLKTIKLTRPLDNVTWQAGQIAFMLQAFKRHQNYALIIVKEDKLLILGDFNNVQSVLNHSDNIGLL
jgi:hypothetical protein